MISKVTETNKSLITARLEQINQALSTSGSSTRVTDFQSYFANIVEISRITTNFIGSDGQKTPYKFLLMPLDEPLFEIDANARTIKVPNSFSKNGVGVRGDHMAEILYFSIDRYYDYQDLFNVDDIIINWQFRGANDSRNAEVETQTSFALAPDDEYIPGKVVFGWVITEDMTPSKGTLTFSVSFMKKTAGVGGAMVYQYALNTQVATVSVNDALVLEDPNVLTTLQRPTFDRLTNSRYTPKNVEPLADPAFEQDLPLIANFAISDTEENAELMLTAIGKTVDDGIIKYAWNGKYFDGSTFAGRDMDSPTALSDYIQLPNTYVKPDDEIDNTNYFIMTREDEVIIPVLLTSTTEPALSDVFDRERHPNRDLYILGTSQVVTSAGMFKVSAQSTREVGQTYNLVEPALEQAQFVPNMYYTKDTNNVYVPAVIWEENTDYYTGTIYQNSGIARSSTCTVPYAAVPSVNIEVINSIPIEGDIENGVKPYSVLEVHPELAFIESGVAPSIRATISNSGVLDADHGIVAESELGLVAIKQVTENAVIPAIEDFSDFNTTLVREIEPQAKEGPYVVYAANKRNHTYSISEPSNVLVVSYIAPDLSSKISVSCDDLVLISHNEAQGNAQIDIGGPDPTSRTFTISVDDWGDYLDSVQLYLNVLEVDYNKLRETPGNNSTPLKSREDILAMILANGEESILVDEANINKYEIDMSAETYSFTVDNDSGYYLIEAITNYHGTQRVAITDLFNIKTAV